jgi:hypothetical protein
VKVYIDQSGKVEDTSKPTVVAFSNGKSRAVYISKKEKRKLIKAVRQLDYPKTTFVYKLFSGLIFILLYQQNVDEVFIDIEYEGHNSDIKNILIHLFNKNSADVPNIRFTLVGKKSNVHKKAIEVFRNKQSVEKIVKSEDLLKLLYGQ